MNTPSYLTYATAAAAFVASSTTRHGVHGLVATSVPLHHSSRRLENSRGRRSTSLHAYSELDGLRTRREDIMRRHAPEDAVVDESETSQHESEEGRGLEYLADGERDEGNEAGGMYHLILMPSTFTSNSLSVRYATRTLASSLPSLPEEKAYDAAVFAAHQGFANLGTYGREECLELGEMLGEAGLDCRVVPRDDVAGDPLADGRSSEGFSHDHEAVMGEIAAAWSLSSEPSPVEPIPEPSYALSGWAASSLSSPPIVDEGLGYDDALVANLACELALDVVNVDASDEVSDSLDGGLRRPYFYEDASSEPLAVASDPARIEVTSVPPSAETGRGRAFVEDTYLLSFTP